MNNSKINPNREMILTNLVISYPVHIEKTMKINKGASIILDFILILMDHTNMVYLGGDTVYTMRKLMKQINGSAYTVQTIRNNLHELAKNGLIIKYYKKNYMVNPKYFLSYELSEKRTRLINDLHENGYLSKVK